MMLPPDWSTLVIVNILELCIVLGVISQGQQMMLPPDWRLTGTLVIVNILELCIRRYQLGSVDDAATGLETDWYTCDCEYTLAMYQVLLVRVSR